jgi:hypothetical protein
VFVGAAERQVSSFPTNDGNSMLVEDLLTWVITFTTSEAPKLVHEGGRRGVAAIQPTAILLEDLVDQLLDSLSTAPTIPAGMRHPRVRRPLEELHGYLEQVQLLAEEVRSPLRAGV